MKKTGKTPKLFLLHMKKIAAISTGPITHLDHLAPICDWLKIPLVVVEHKSWELGKQFYPMVDIHYVPLEKLTLAYLATNFDAIVTCGKFWAMELKPVLKQLFQKEMRFIFAPHGRSDKEDFLDKPIEQDLQLVYKAQSEKDLSIGNIRKAFYEKYRSHFDALAAPFFAAKKPTVLYAPTWKTTATGTSFFSQAENIIERLKVNYHLIVKLHPLLEENNPALYHRIIGKHEQDATFIETFPPVYPILDKTDIYLGDYSSVGYDFLSYNRPMYFLKDGGKLSSCGELFSQPFGKQIELAPKREKLYLASFDKEVAISAETLIQQL